ncbi:uncharacterized protein LOC136040964 isoform X2 [Artemia franciscana]|uniref:uncharacterized protein LOC136040964 isoform X2 n=1 Tax=Artemia franciscana TaxID=6661 RepID=UPI0032DAB4B1
MSKASTVSKLSRKKTTNQTPQENKLSSASLEVDRTYRDSIDFTDYFLKARQNDRLQTAPRNGHAALEVSTCNSGAKKEERIRRRSILKLSPRKVFSARKTILPEANESIIVSASDDQSSSNISGISILSSSDNDSSILAKGHDLDGVTNKMKSLGIKGLQDECDTSDSSSSNSDNENFEKFLQSIRRPKKESINRQEYSGTSSCYDSSFIDDEPCEDSLDFYLRDMKKTYVDEMLKDQTGVTKSSGHQKRIHRSSLSTSNSRSSYALSNKYSSDQLVASKTSECKSNSALSVDNECSSLAPDSENSCNSFLEQEAESSWSEISKDETDFSGFVKQDALTFSTCSYSSEKEEINDSENPSSDTAKFEFSSPERVCTPTDNVAVRKNKLKIRSSSCSRGHNKQNKKHVLSTDQNTSEENSSTVFSFKHKSSRVIVHHKKESVSIDSTRKNLSSSNCSNSSCEYKLRQADVSLRNNNANKTVINNESISYDEKKHSNKIIYSDSDDAESSKRNLSTNYSSIPSGSDVAREEHATIEILTCNGRLSESTDLVKDHHTFSSSSCSEIRRLEIRSTLSESSLSGSSLDAKVNEINPVVTSAFQTLSDSLQFFEELDLQSNPPKELASSITLRKGKRLTAKGCTLMHRSSADSSNIEFDLQLKNEIQALSNSKGSSGDLTGYGNEYRGRFDKSIHNRNRNTIFLSSNANMESLSKNQFLSDSNSSTPEICHVNIDFDISKKFLAFESKDNSLDVYNLTAACKDGIVTDKASSEKLSEFVSPDGTITRIVSIPPLDERMNELRSQTLRKCVSSLGEKISCQLPKNLVSDEGDGTITRIVNVPLLEDRVSLDLKKKKLVEDRTRSISRDRISNATDDISLHVELSGIKRLKAKTDHYKVNDMVKSEEENYGGDPIDLETSFSELVYLQPKDRTKLDIKSTDNHATWTVTEKNQDIPQDKIIDLTLHSPPWKLKTEESICDTPAYTPALVKVKKRRNRKADMKKLEDNWSSDESDKENKKIGGMLHCSLEELVPKTPTMKPILETIQVNINGNVGSTTQKKIKKFQRVENLEKATFLESLNEDLEDSKRHPEAVDYIRNFKKRKDELIGHLFHLFNTEVFEGQVCDRASRVRDTLLHEMCHAAVWLVYNVRDKHGPFWKSWAQIASVRFPEIPLVSRCHAYEISTKFIYKCNRCDYSTGRHSKSINIDTHRCPYCRSSLTLLVNATPSKANNGETPMKVEVKTPRAPNPFALFVKENYGSIKKKGMKHADVMQTLSKNFALAKIK